MNRMPLLKSRLKMPEMPKNIVIPEHIHELHEIMKDKNAIVICAPAGYGKTTFLSSFFQISATKDRRVCWYTLETEDREPQVFLAYLIEALFPASDSKWSGTLTILDECSNTDSDIHYIISIICQEMWSYFNSSEAAPIALVFDDFHHVCDIPEICETVSFLHSNLPPNCTFFISSRYDNGIFTEKQKLDRKILELASNDLCFTENDVKRLFPCGPSACINENLAENIVKHTEGWIAGITIIYNALKDRNFKDSSDWLEKYGGKASLFSYFSSEILKALEPEMLDFLVKASLLCEFTAEDTEAILDLHNVSQLVESCIAKGVFIQKIYTGDALMYRFHALFREALIEIQPQYLSPEKIKEYNLCAANYFLKKKMYGKAIEHLLKLDDIVLVNNILMKESITMDVFEDFNQLHLLFDLLPENIVSGNVVLLFIKGLTYMHSRYEDSFKALTLAFESARQNSDFLMQLNIALALVYAYYSTNNMSGIKKLLSQVQKPAQPYASPSLAAAVSLLEMIQAVFSDSLKAASSIFTKIDSTALDQNLKWPYHVISCMLHYRLGRHDSAISAIKGALELEEIGKSPILKAQADMFYSFPLMLKKDIHSLKPIVSYVLSVGEKNDFGYLLGNGKLVSAYVKYIENDMEGALECLEYSVMYFNQMGNPAMSHFSKLVKYLWMSQESNPLDLIPDAQKTLELLKKLHAGYELLEIGQSILGVLQRTVGDYSSAEKNFLSAISASEKKGALQVSCGAHMHLAKLYFDSGNLRGGIDHLRIAFEKASSNSFHIFWDIHYPTLVEMCARSIKLSISADYGQKLIEEHFGKAAAEFFRTNLGHLEDMDIENFTSDFLSSRSPRRESLIPVIRVNMFGEFRIQAKKAFIPEEAWKTKKIKGLFVYLLLNNGKAVTREFLTSLLWPESDKKSASMSFRAALYELKRVLSHYGMISADGSTIVHETATGLEINKSENLIIDLDEFMNLSHRINALPSDMSEASHKINLLEKMVALYKGDLLEFEAYDDWIMFDCEKSKSVFINCALMLAVEYIKRGEVQKAESSLFKLLSHEPFNEEAALQLISLYISTDQNSRAARFYNVFKKRTENELGVKIDNRLTAAIQAISVM